jgi:hypothetical protein
MMSVLGSENGETEGSNECSSPVAVTEMGGRISSVIFDEKARKANIQEYIVDNAFFKREPCQ